MPWENWYVNLGPCCPPPIINTGWYAKVTSLLARDLSTNQSLQHVKQKAADQFGCDPEAVQQMVFSAVESYTFSSSTDDRLPPNWYKRCVEYTDNQITIAKKFRDEVTLSKDDFSSKCLSAIPGGTLQVEQRESVEKLLSSLQEELNYRKESFALHSKMRNTERLARLCVLVFMLTGQCFRYTDITRLLNIGLDASGSPEVWKQDTLSKTIRRFRCQYPLHWSVLLEHTFMEDVFQLLPPEQYGCTVADIEAGKYIQVRPDPSGHFTFEIPITNDHGTDGADKSDCSSLESFEADNNSP